MTDSLLKALARGEVPVALVEEELKRTADMSDDRCEHTPIPWEMQEADPSEGVGIIGSNLGGLVAISCMQPTEFDAGDTRRAEANAAFIVKAANNHRSLVEALYATTCELSHCAAQLAHLGRPGHPEDSVGRALKKARAILAAVNQEERGND